MYVLRNSGTNGNKKWIFTKVGGTGWGCQNIAIDLLDLSIPIFNYKKEDARPRQITFKAT